MAYALEGLAAVLLAEYNPGLAARLLGASQRLFDDFQAKREGGEQALYERTRNALAEVLGPEEFQREESYGRELRMEEAIELALNARGQADTAS